MKISLGDKVRDTITGFEGRVTGRAEYISGCIQYAVTPPVNKDGEMADANWIDEQRIEIIESKSVIGRPSGGPQADAPKGVR